MASATPDDPPAPLDRPSAATGTPERVKGADPAPPASPRARGKRRRREDPTTEDPPDDPKRSIEALRELLLKLLDDHDGHE